jgi:tRNA threonylcarbamoyl adenosine modification protein (Sua5/YciO/YrdC/YwlC family)
LTQFFDIHPENPQQRLVCQVAASLKEGGIIVYPTDSAYALGCHIGDKAALERIRALRQLDKNHNFTLICRDLSELATYAKVDNSMYRLLKAYTPGAYTFILPATREVPRRLQHPKRKTIGLRIPDNNIVKAILEEFGEPLMSVTLIMPGDDLPLADPEEIYNKLDGRVDVIVNGGFCGLEPTTIIEFIDGVPQVIRAGKGDVTPFKVT